MAHQLVRHVADNKEGSRLTTEPRTPRTVGGGDYQHPASFTPPLAYGGHEFLAHGDVATCWGCGATVPVWSAHEGLWMTFTARWCPNKVAALGAGKTRRERARRPTMRTELPGQLSIFDVLGET